MLALDARAFRCRCAERAGLAEAMGSVRASFAKREAGQRRLLLKPHPD